MTTTNHTPKLNRYERAKMLGTLGYAISENVFAPRLYTVHKPTGERYTVDLEREACNCPATVRDCAHLLFAQRCVRFAARMTASRDALRARKARRRAVRIAAWSKPVGARIAPDVRKAFCYARRAYEAYQAHTRQEFFSFHAEERLHRELESALTYAAYVSKADAGHVDFAVCSLAGPLDWAIQIIREDMAAEGIGAV